MKKFICSFIFAGRGIQILLKQRNAKVQVATAMVYAILAYVNNFSLLKWSIFLLCCAMVLSLEAINTALEKLCDFVQPDKHEIIAIIKDLATGAVLLTAISSAIIGLLLLL